MCFIQKRFTSVWIGEHKTDQSQTHTKAANTQSWSPCCQPGKPLMTPTVCCASPESHDVLMHMICVSAWHAYDQYFFNDTKYPTTRSSSYHLRKAQCRQQVRTTPRDSETESRHLMANNFKPCAIRPDAIRQQIAEQHKQERKT